MIPRSVLISLVFGLVLMLVAFAVLMAFHALVLAMGDAVAARAIFWAAITCLVLLVVDVLLLLAALGLRAIDRSDDSRSN